MIELLYCDAIFESTTAAKLGLNAECTLRERSLVVKFGNSATLKDEKVFLNSQRVLAATGVCNFNRENLESLLSYPQKIPPVCDFSYRMMDVLEVHARGSSGGLGRPLTFTWNIPGEVSMPEVDRV